MIKCHIYTRSLVKDEKNRKRDTLFPNISNVYNKKCNGNGIRGVLCPVSVITVKNTYIPL